MLKYIHFNTFFTVLWIALAFFIAHAMTAYASDVTSPNALHQEINGGIDMQAHSSNM